MRQLDLFNVLEEDSKEPEPSRKLVGLVPTFEVHFFDKNMKQRAAWYRAKDEDGAKTQVINEYGRAVSVINIKLSDRELEVIEALD